MAELLMLLQLFEKVGIALEFIDLNFEDQEYLQKKLLLGQHFFLVLVALKNLVDPNFAFVSLSNCNHFIRYYERSHLIKQPLKANDRFLH